MDKRKGLLNICVSVALKITAMLLVILAKRFLIKICGNDINGLNALYLSIIGFLSVAELGVGSAISYCMYKPIVEGDTERVSALYHLFRKLYFIVGGVILALGVFLSPLLPLLAKDYASLNVNLYSTFYIMLVSVVITYAFGAKTALINAHKNNYITAAISLGGLAVQYIMQICVLILSGSFEGFLLTKIAIALLQWIATNVVVRRKYQSIVCKKTKIDAATGAEVGKNIKAMFLHKIGYVLVNTVDSIIISAFNGVAVLGMFSNYSSIIASLTSVLNMVFASLTAVVGHLYVEENKERSREYSEAFHLLNFLLGTVFFLGYYAVIDDLVSMVFSAELIMDRSITIVLTLNGFIQFLRQSTLLFRDATGTFYHDRWKPVFEGLSNLFISIVLIQWIGITGVVVGTIITNIFICHIIEPYVLYKNAFACSPHKYFLRNYAMILVFALCVVVMSVFYQDIQSRAVSFLVNGCISVAISIFAVGIVIFASGKKRKLLSELVRRRLRGNQTDT